jgi:ATP-dependent Lon protease
MSKDHNTSAFSMIADYEGDIRNLFETGVDGDLPILATRNLVMFPGVVSPIMIGRPMSLKLIDMIRKSPNIMFAIFCQKDPSVESPGMDDLFEYGVFAKAVRILELPHDAGLSVIVQGFGRCKLKGLTKSRRC